MENKQPTFLDLLLEAHIGLDRQGPGSTEAMKQALGFLGPLDRFQNAADLGCGSGGQTIELAKHIPGTVTGLDMFQQFIDKLNSNAKACGLSHRVKGITGKMEELPFEPASLDLIWSEGAIDNIGFGEGLKHWRGFLKDGGYVAVTCPSWFTQEHPDVVAKFWKDAGSSLETVDDNIRVLQESGYAFVAAFALPEECWIKNYFEPRAQAIRKLTEKYGPCDTVTAYAAINQQEVDLYMKYRQHYGYVFYIGKAI